MERDQTPVDLMEAARELLEEARAGDAGRAAKTLLSGPGARLSQTLLALTAGSSLQEHRAPGPATIQIVVGDGLLTSNGATVLLSAGEWATIPLSVHTLEARHDLAALLTVMPT